MAGHMGDERVTVQNLHVVRVDVDRNLILVKGSVPGANGGLVTTGQAIQRAAVNAAPGDGEREAEND